MWERRHGFPCPARLPSGHRRYGERDVEAVARIAAQRAVGTPLALSRAIEEESARVAGASCRAPPPRASSSQTSTALGRRARGRTRSRSRRTIRWRASGCSSRRARSCGLPVRMGGGRAARRSRVDASSRRSGPSARRSWTHRAMRDARRIAHLRRARGVPRRSRRRPSRAPRRSGRPTSDAQVELSCAIANRALACL